MAVAVCSAGYSRGGRGSLGCGSTLIAAYVSWTNGSCKDLVRAITKEIIADYIRVMHNIVYIVNNNFKKKNLLSCCVARFESQGKKSLVLARELTRE